MNLQIIAILLCTLGFCFCLGCTEKRISLREYEDKVYASWLGQCIGNMYGLAHEFKYNDEPRTEPITGWAESSLQRIREADGAFSDDDTDIEYVDLFCMERYGPEPLYENIAACWKQHINHHIGVANRAARDLMERGYLPPLTGRRGVNPHWFQIDAQLVCEIWAVTAPGMLEYAAAKADWAAKVTNDDYGTHPTLWYNVMYAAAFFESDVGVLCQIGYEHVPAESIFRTAIDDVRSWKAEHGEDWLAVRGKIKEKYHDRVGLPEEIKTGHVSALLNGALGVLALLYGQGDFERTMNYACMAGYDADNQCATLAGLIAIIHGSDAIPRKYTHVLEAWDMPLNDLYRNQTRDDLPDGRLTDMARRTAELGRQIVTRHGGRIEGNGDNAVMVIDTEATFSPSLEIRLFPIYITVDESAEIHPVIIGGAGRAIQVTLAGEMPPGMGSEMGPQGMIISGIPQRIGKYNVIAGVSDGEISRSTVLPVYVRTKNLALSARQIIAAVRQPIGGGSKMLEVIRDDLPGEHYDSYDGENELAQDYYGYLWDEPVRIRGLKVKLGPVFENGGWFETMQVEYRSAPGEWQPVEHLRLSPQFEVSRARRGYFEFTARFEPIRTEGIRIIGKPGGSAQFTSIQRLEVRGK